MFYKLSVLVMLASCGVRHSSSSLNYTVVTPRFPTINGRRVVVRLPNGWVLARRNGISHGLVSNYSFTAKHRTSRRIEVCKFTVANLQSLPNYGRSEHGFPTKTSKGVSLLENGPNPVGSGGAYWAYIVSDPKIGHDVIVQMWIRNSSMLSQRHFMKYVHENMEFH